MGTETTGESPSSGVSAARRRKRAGIIGTVVVVAALAVVAGVVFGIPGLNRGASQSASHWRLPTVEDHGVPFFRDPAGNRLITHKVGTPGQGEVSLSFKPKTISLMMAGVCTAPFDPDHPRDMKHGYFLHIDVNGNPQIEQQCTGTEDLHQPAHRLFDGLNEPVTNQPGLFMDDIARGQSTTVAAWLSRGIDGSVVSLPSAQVGVGVYQRSSNAVDEHGLYVARQVVWDGSTYQLAARECQQLTHAGTVSLDLPASPYHLYAVAGIAFWSTPVHVRTTPGQGFFVRRPTSGSQPVGLALPRGGTRMSVKVQGQPGSTGLVYIAAYRRLG
jgi:hypothetical protein